MGPRHWGAFSSPQSFFHWSCLCSTPASVSPNLRTLPPLRLRSPSPFHSELSVPAPTPSPSVLPHSSRLPAQLGPGPSPAPSSFLRWTLLTGLESLWLLLQEPGHGPPQRSLGSWYQFLQGEGCQQRASGPSPQHGSGHEDWHWRSLLLLLSLGVSHTHRATRLFSGVQTAPNVHAFVIIAKVF